MTSTELQGIVRFRFHDGAVEEFKRLAAQCMEIVRAKERGTLQYDTYFKADETESTVSRSASTSPCSWTSPRTGSVRRPALQLGVGRVRSRRHDDTDGVWR